MKKRVRQQNQQTFKVSDATHALATVLAQRFGVSKSLLVDVALRRLDDGKDTLTLQARDPRVRRANVRTVLNPRPARGKKGAGR